MKLRKYACGLSSGVVDLRNQVIRPRDRFVNRRKDGEVEFLVVVRGLPGLAFDYLRRPCLPLSVLEQFAAPPIICATIAFAIRPRSSLARTKSPQSVGGHGRG